MPTQCIRVGQNYDLDLSMYPSFLSSIYNFVEPKCWVRRIGPRHTLVQLGGKLCCIGEGCSHKLLWGISGLWCWHECTASLKASRYRWLLYLYPGLRVAAALDNVDRILVSSAVILSINTRYASNVRRWLKLVFADKQSGGLSIVKAVLNAEKLSSPQPRFLAKVLPTLSRIVSEINSLEPSVARGRLLSIKGVGPKTADAILLFTGATSMVAPGDRHFVRFVKSKLGFSGRLGSKRECTRRGPWCQTCSLNSYCLQGQVVKFFGAGAGLVQTISYVYGRLGTHSWRRRLYRELETLYRE